MWPDRNSLEKRFAIENSNKGQTKHAQYASDLKYHRQKRCSITIHTSTVICVSKLIGKNKQTTFATMWKEIIVKPVILLAILLLDFWHMSGLLRSKQYLNERDIIHH